MICMLHSVRGNMLFHSVLFNTAEYGKDAFVVLVNVGLFLNLDVSNILDL